MKAPFWKGTPFKYFRSTSGNNYAISDRAIASIGEKQALGMAYEAIKQNPPVIEDPSNPEVIGTVHDDIEVEAWLVKARDGDGAEFPMLFLDTVENLDSYYLRSTN